LGSVPAGREAESRDSKDNGEDEEFNKVEEKEASDRAEGLFQEEAAEESRNNSDGEEVEAEFNKESSAASVGAVGNSEGLAGFLVGADTGEVELVVTAEGSATAASRRERSGGGALGGVDEHRGCRENRGQDTSSGE